MFPGTPWTVLQTDPLLDPLVSTRRLKRQELQDALITTWSTITIFYKTIK